MPEQEEEVCGTYYGGIFVYFGLSNMVRLFAFHRTLWVGYYVALHSLTCCSLPFTILLLFPSRNMGKKIKEESQILFFH